MSATIEINNLNKSFEKIAAVSDFNFKAYSGEVIALLGPNGAGKSTLMNMISGFLSPDSGEIKVLGQDVSANPLFTKKNIGFLPEGSPLYGDMTVKKFLLYISELKSLSEKDVSQAMLLSNITHVADQKIETLSKGYKRRTGFAVSLLGNPPILLLDEPTDGLDPNQKEHMLKLIVEMGKEKTILVSTHLLDEAEAAANRILVMNNGRIKADGCLESVLKQTKTTSIENAFIKLTRQNEND